ncbi:hypothetical protein KIPB_007369, partial [Kipferlia bialata]|eukprot:g7369.t1
MTAANDGVNTPIALSPRGGVLDSPTMQLLRERFDDDTAPEAEPLDDDLAGLDAKLAAMKEARTERLKHIEEGEREIEREREREREAAEQRAQKERERQERERLKAEQLERDRERDRLVEEEREKEREREREVERRAAAKVEQEKREREARETEVDRLFKEREEAARKLREREREREAQHERELEAERKRAVEAERERVALRERERERQRAAEERKTQEERDRKAAAELRKKRDKRDKEREREERKRKTRIHVTPGDAVFVQEGLERRPVSKKVRVRNMGTDQVLISARVAERSFATNLATNMSCVSPSASAFSVRVSARQERDGGVTTKSDRDSASPVVQLDPQEAVVFTVSFDPSADTVHPGGIAFAKLVLQVNPLSLPSSASTLYQVPLCGVEGGVSLRPEGSSEGSGSLALTPCASEGEGERESISFAGTFSLVSETETPTYMTIKDKSPPGDILVPEAYSITTTPVGSVLEGKGDTAVVRVVVRVYLDTLRVLIRDRLPVEPVFKGAVVQVLYGNDLLRQLCGLQGDPRPGLERPVSAISKKLGISEDLSDRLAEGLEAITLPIALEDAVLSYLGRDAETKGERERERDAPLTRAEMGNGHAMAVNRGAAMHQQDTTVSGPGVATVTRTFQGP